jgi:hypothetical protein
MEGERVVAHSGGSAGISAVVSFMPERGVGFVMLANTTPNPLRDSQKAGALLWPLILGETPAPIAAPPAASAAAPEAPASPAADLPAVDALLARMVRAAGGARALRRHRSLAIRAVKTYEHQGVQAEVSIQARAPAMRVEEEVWTAAGREIGRVRIYFDGTAGGQETTFGQDYIHDAAQNRRARRDSAFSPLLEIRDLYRELRVVDSGTVDGAKTYVLELVPEEGETVRLHVSARTALVVRREVGGETATFADHRRVDGEMIPFRTTIQDALGETSVRVGSARFGAAIPDGAFAPRPGSLPRPPSRRQ